MAKNEKCREILDKFIEKNPDMARSEVIKANLNLDVNQATLYRWYDRKVQTGTTSRFIASGRPVKIATEGKIRRIRNCFNHRSGRSQTKYARRINCHQTYIGKILKNKTNVKCRKKLKRPYQTDKQRKDTRPKCRRLLQNNRYTEFIIDDESYFNLSNSSAPGNDRFYSNDLSKTPEDVLYKSVRKYEPKLLVWLAISPQGVSKPFIAKSGMAIDQERYLDIIKKYLEPFIAEKYPQGGYVFWPDLASSHYAHSVQDYLKSKNIRFVPREDNPANLPKARPIEDFWGNLKMSVYANDWQAKNLGQLENRIRSCLKKTDLKLVQAHAEGVPRRLDQIRRGNKI